MDKPSRSLCLPPALLTVPPAEHEGAANQTLLQDVLCPGRAVPASRRYCALSSPRAQRRPRALRSSRSAVGLRHPARARGGAACSASAMLSI